jgi:hypothetical protein
MKPQNVIAMVNSADMAAEAALAAIAGRKKSDQQRVGR